MPCRKSRNLFLEIYFSVLKLAYSYAGMVACCSRKGIDVLNPPSIPLDNYCEVFKYYSLVHGWLTELKHSCMCLS